MSLGPCHKTVGGSMLAKKWFISLPKTSLASAIEAGEIGCGAIADCGSKKNFALLVAEFASMIPVINQSISNVTLRRHIEVRVFGKKSISSSDSVADCAWRRQPYF